eukprot:2155991-Rhodomonas_salina.2
MSNDADHDVQVVPESMSTSQTVFGCFLGCLQDHGSRSSLRCRVDSETDHTNDDDACDAMDRDGQRWRSRCG